MTVRPLHKDPLFWFIVTLLLTAIALILLNVGEPGEALEWHQ